MTRPASRLIAASLPHKALCIVIVWFVPLLLIAQDNTGIKNPLNPVIEEVEIENPPAALRLDPFYKKYVDANGIAVVSSEETSDDALLVAREIVNSMLQKRPDIQQELIVRKCRILIMGQHESQVDLPEYGHLKKPLKDDKRLTDAERLNYDASNGIGAMSDRAYWDKRARGMGGSNRTSCAEENLLGLKGDRYYGENIFIHEFSHTIFFAIKKVDPDLYAAVEAAYEKARQKGLYKGQYAINTLAEYWAEGTQWWFWSNMEFYDGERRVQSPGDLEDYDPGLYKLLEEVYVGHHIPADIYYGQNLRPAR